MTARDLHLPVAAQPSLEHILSYAELAEHTGYDRIWAPETWGRDAVTTLALAADRLEQVGLGTSIVNVYARSPALLGQTAATLAEATDQPFRLGIGPSGPALIEGWHATSFDRPLRRTRETAEIIRAVLSGEVVSYDGDIFSLDGFRLRCEPPSTPISIDIAGMGPKAVELAGFVGDGWHALLLTQDGLDDRLEALADGAAKSGRSIDDIRVTLSLPCCALEDGEQARRVTAGHIAFYLGAMGPFYRTTLSNQGYESEVERVVDAWESGRRDEAVAIVAETMLDALAVAGTPESAREQLDEVASNPGIDAIAVSLPRGANQPAIEATIEALAPST